MDPSSPRWKEITPSELPWEREALAFVRQGLPDHEPYRAWSNFELLALDGSVNEVDLLVLAPGGLFLVEIKSRPGELDGDAGTWTWRSGGRLYTDDSPLILANKKAKRLRELLDRQRSAKERSIPFVRPLVFCSAPDLVCRLSEHARQGVYLRDREASAEHGPRRGILWALTAPASDPGQGQGNRPRLDRPAAKAVSRAMEEAGIRPSRRARRVGDWIREELLHEGSGYQDWAARHATLEKTRRRIRIYTVAAQASAELRQTLAGAARREFEILTAVSHPGILAVHDYVELDQGPALLFDHDPGAQRLDHFVRDHGDRLGVEQRLSLLRQIAEAIGHAHSKRLVHRALAAQSVLVRDPDSLFPRAQILNWQTAAAAMATCTHPGERLTATVHIEPLIESPARVYVAPEAWMRPASAGEQADVFSLGAIAYLLFSGQPPARDLVELQEKLREGHGLAIESVLDGAGTALRELIRDATNPDLLNRYESAADLLLYLEAVEDELTRPDAPPAVDPNEARKDDVIAPGLRVVKRLGRGSTATVFVVEREGAAEPEILKLSLDATHDAVLRDEGEVLVKLRHQHVVEYRGTIEIGGRCGLLMAQAGEETLAQRLRREGRLDLELLERLGEDLLATLDWLEQQGIAHRDVKPENIVLRAAGRGSKLDLVLLDFSLSRASAESIHAGTPAYLDPFLSLRRPQRWDASAERFSAAMTLHEMATGTLPRWGDGASNPALLDCEATVDAELFDPAVREPMAAFFAQALRREARQRFDNAEEMLRAWRRVFVEASRPALPAEEREGAGEDTGAGAGAGAGAWTGFRLDGVTPATPLVAVGLSNRALNALERRGVHGVGALLGLSRGQIACTPGIGTKTRREIADLLRELRLRLPEGAGRGAAAAVPPSAPASVSASACAAAGAAAASPGGAATQASASVLGLPAPEPETEDEPGPPTVERLVRALLPERAAVRDRPSHEQLAAFLGLRAAEPAAGAKAPGEEARAAAAALAPRWPSQTEVAERFGLTRARIGQVVAKARERWARLPEITALRDDVACLLDERGGVATAAELATGLLALRASVSDEPARSALASAVARAAVETEKPLASARWIVRRRGAVVLVARDDPAAGLDGERLADWAEALGRRADELAALSPLPAAARALEALRAMRGPRDGEAVASSRLLELAAAASEHAAVSSRLEIYPRGMAPVRALKLAQGALAGVDELTVEDLRGRVRARFPAAEPLPERPRLDELLGELACDLAWRPSRAGGAGAYVSRAVDVGQLTSSSSGLRRLGTAAGASGASGAAGGLGRPGAPGAPTGAAALGLPGAAVAEGAAAVEADAKLLAARDFEERLERAVRRGGFLALLVPPRYAGRVAEEIARRFPVERMDLDRLFIAALRAAAEKMRVRWEVVLGADAEGPKGAGWPNLLRLVGLALPDLEARLHATGGTALLLKPGLLARYGRLDVLERLRDAAGEAAGSSGAWVLVPAPESSPLPAIDAAALPVIAPSQWARVPEAWIENRHRAAAETGGPVPAGAP